MDKANNPNQEAVLNTGITLTYNVNSAKDSCEATANSEKDRCVNQAYNACVSGTAAGMGKCDDECKKHCSEAAVNDCQKNAYERVYAECCIASTGNKDCIDYEKRCESTGGNVVTNYMNGTCMSSCMSSGVTQSQCYSSCLGAAQEKALEAYYDCCTKNTGNGSCSSVTCKNQSYCDTLANEQSSAISCYKPKEECLAEKKEKRKEIYENCCKTTGQGSYGS